MCMPHDDSHTSHSVPSERSSAVLFHVVMGALVLLVAIAFYTL
jgi:hypothetical protein